ncbi:phage late control D family protein [Falsihalocynthiibacter sp. S25ZX9]|uniref:phage late control D family protein n=1 Tax=Falsihalocynthiibacter sp. S25ZX9 TaxID=3240870 RepID=UPI0035102EAD
MGLIDFRPLVQVSINGIPLSGFIFSQLSSVSVSDSAGFISDTAEITFANVSKFSQFIMPEPGAEISVGLGYLSGFRNMGVFIADEVEESSPPRNIHITARAKSQGLASNGMGPITQQKTRSWSAGLTLENIATNIAAENGLTLAISANAAPIVPGHIDQIDESDIAVLTRIALAYDLVAKPAGGRLFIGRRADSVSASGAPMPVTSLLSTDVSRWRMRRSLGEAVGTVIATYRDLAAAKDVEVKIGDKEPVRRLRERFRDEATARGMADAEARRGSRSVETLEVEMVGNPSIVAESKILPLDFSSAAAGEWLVENAVHSVSDAGFVTTVKAQRPI